MIQIHQNKISFNEAGNNNLFNPAITNKVFSFHKTFKDYSPTPLISLNGLSNNLGISKIWIKDESRRFGLNSFKVLGASYALAKYIYEHLELNKNDFSFSLFNKEEIKERTKDLTLVTATDGNHGRGVAWSAHQLDCKCVVYMPEGTTPTRYNNIKMYGAEVKIIGGSYDDAVNLAKNNSKKFGWLLLQDTSWDGYENIPQTIMQGYSTIMEEISIQLKDRKPTHVFIQCGVGSFPAAMLGFILQNFKNDRPVFTVVEPNDAACVYESVKSNKIISLLNKMNSIMAGLSCGTPGTIAFDILKNHSDFFIKCSDEITIKGMQILGRGEFGDPKITSGESGAVTTGLIYYLLSDRKYKQIAGMLKLNKDSKILLISTEGDTDPGIYSKILAK